MMLLVSAALLRFWLRLPTLDTLTTNIFIAGMVMEFFVELLIIMALYKYLWGGKK